MTIYILVIYCICCGIFIQFIIKSTLNIDPAVKATAMAAARKNEAHILSFNRFSSFFPKHIENTTPLPMQSPNIIDVRKVISAKADPTAARASEPTNFPTTHVSTTL